MAKKKKKKSNREKLRADWRNPKDTSDLVPVRDSNGKILYWRERDPDGLSRRRA
tara:strand:+ start:2682 stop:2843 length:162 start_codon:yes stop_codon:yes gene_type:complete